jgi:predicted NBD/HSP70 family sugar kinase
MRNGRAAHSGVREHNRKLVLRAIYTQTADNRAALAEQTGLAKPTISTLVAELMDEGLVVEEGRGESTESGGKRPRLLHFMPQSRQVIGIALHQNYVLGVLVNLDGHIVVEHRAALHSTQQTEVFTVLVEVINGLIAQLTAPLLCMSVGIPAVVDDVNGIVRYAPRFGWRDVPLAGLLCEHYHTAVYVSNSPELAARAQAMFSHYPAGGSLATVLITNSIGFGLVSRDSATTTGSDIGHLLLPHAGATVEQLLGWQRVAARARELARAHHSARLADDSFTYLHLRHAAAQGDTAALALLDELSGYVAQIFSWVIALLRPQHLSLAGAIANLGEPFLGQVVSQTRALVLADLIAEMSFSVNDADNLVAIGAAAKAVEYELGIS